MSGIFDDEIERESFSSQQDYFEFRIREGMAGHDYDFSDRTVIGWALDLIDNYRWGDLQDWMDWSWEDMQDFWDWWREEYGEG